MPHIIKENVLINYQQANYECIFIPNNVRIIEKGAFQNVKAKYVIIPRTVELIKKFSFFNCNISNVIILGEYTKVEHNIIDKNPDYIYYPEYAYCEHEIKCDYGNYLHYIDGYDSPSSDFPAREMDEEELKEMVGKILNMNIDIDDIIL